jgi:hypothetical protein
MIDSGEIERALEALWKGRTGASLLAITRQPVLMGLEHVVEQARGESGLVEPSSHRVAEVLRDRMSQACDRYAGHPDGPDLARDLLGLTDESRGKTRRARRTLVEDRYDVSEDWLTHKRREPGSSLISSPETEMVGLVTEALAEDEHQHGEGKTTRLSGLERLDYIDSRAGDHFQCTNYVARLTIGPKLGGVSIMRRLTLSATNKDARHLCLHDGWSLPDLPFASLLYFDNLLYGSHKPSPVDRYDHLAAQGMPTRIQKFDLRHFLRREGSTPVIIDTGYLYRDDWQLREAGPLSFGFYLAKGDAPTNVALYVSLPEIAEDVTVRVMSYDNGPRIETEWQPSRTTEGEYEGDFVILEPHTTPGFSYSVRWHWGPIGNADFPIDQQVTV